MVHLTKQEKSIILIVVGLFLFGLAVKTLRQMKLSHEPIAATTGRIGP